jgi:hypothetical protein
MGMTHRYGVAADTGEMIRLIRSAADQGVTLFDTDSRHSEIRVSVVPATSSIGTPGPTRCW